MKHMVLLFLLVAGSFFGWRWLMKKGEKRVAGKWGRRVGAALFVGAVAVVGLFAVLSSTSWRFF
jgi:hypothetical protein